MTSEVIQSIGPGWDPKPCSVLWGEQGAAFDFLLAAGSILAPGPDADEMQARLVGHHC
jgi:hypothetical protein